MVFMVKGGVFTDTTFSKLAGTPEVYGPFDTAEDARKTWNDNTWRNVDNAHHRLQVVDEAAALATSNEAYLITLRDETNLLYKLVDKATWDFIFNEGEITKEMRDAFRNYDGSEDLTDEQVDSELTNYKTFDTWTSSDVALAVAPSFFNGEQFDIEGSIPDMIQFLNHHGLTIALQFDGFFY